MHALPLLGCCTVHAAASQGCSRASESLVKPECPAALQKRGVLIPGAKVKSPGHGQPPGGLRPCRAPLRPARSLAVRAGCRRSRGAAGEQGGRSGARFPPPPSLRRRTRLPQHRAASDFQASQAWRAAQPALAPRQRVCQARTQGRWSTHQPQGRSRAGRGCGHTRRRTGAAGPPRSSAARGAPELVPMAWAGAEADCLRPGARCVHAAAHCGMRTAPAVPARPAVSREQLATASQFCH